jgi:hypothetical protein
MAGRGIAGVWMRIVSYIRMDYGLMSGRKETRVQFSFIFGRS